MLQKKGVTTAIEGKELSRLFQLARKHGQDYREPPSKKQRRSDGGANADENDSEEEDLSEYMVTEKLTDEVTAQINKIIDAVKMSKPASNNL